MYSICQSTLRKQKPASANTNVQGFLLLGSEPLANDYAPGRYLTLRYQNRYLARRRLRRNIARLRREQS